MHDDTLQDVLPLLGIGMVVLLIAFVNDFVVRPWLERKEREAAKFCSYCGCALESRTRQVGRPEFDRITGTGHRYTQVERCCPKRYEEMFPNRIHDGFYIGSPVKIDLPRPEDCEPTPSTSSQ